MLGVGYLLDHAVGPIDLRLNFLDFLIEQLFLEFLVIGFQSFQRRLDRIDAIFMRRYHNKKVVLFLFLLFDLLNFEPTDVLIYDTSVDGYELFLELL